MAPGTDVNVGCRQGYIRWGVGGYQDTQTAVVMYKEPRHTECM